MPRALVINSEDDLWEALESREMLALYDSIEIRDWNPEILYFPDEEILYSLSSSSIRALDEFSRDFMRGYAAMKHGVPSIRRLSYAERANLDIIFVAKGGSTGYDAFGRALNRFLELSVGKMSSTEIFILVLLLLVLFFGTSALGKWLEERAGTEKAKLASDERLHLSEEETKRHAMLTQLTSESLRAIEMKHQADLSKEALARAVAVRPRGRVLGVPMEGEEAFEVVTTERPAAEGRRLDGRFRVTKLIEHAEIGWIAEIENVSGEKFNAELNRQELTQEDIDQVFRSLRENVFVYLQVNVRFVGEKISRAFVMRADSDEGTKIIEG